ncbi:hypothetical protein [Streptomyces virginiae]|uniref:hypothetical protein n=1 Tax=Streptomyces virginiae TaxID=1961 RepID=UPI002F9175B0|nr:hypothetical protein OG253_41100 [Streptomyces virginiae]
MSASNIERTARPRKTRTRSRNINGRPALVISTLHPHQYDLRPACVSLICPDCKTWVPITGIQARQQKLVPHDTGRAGEAPSVRAPSRNRPAVPPTPPPPCDTRLLARFAAADDMIRLRVTADRQAVLIVGEDFLGAQMPARARRDGIGTDDLATLDKVHTAWHHTLADAEPIAMTDGIPAQAVRPRYEVTRDVAETAGDLLKQTLRSTHDMFSTDMPSQALAAYATAGVTAWTAYRYLDALHTADPKLAATLVADTADQLDSGEIGEFAWDAAQKAGHDHKKWSQEFEAWLKSRAKNSTTQPGTNEPSTAAPA